VYPVSELQEGFLFAWSECSRQDLVESEAQHET